MAQSVCSAVSRLRYEPSAPALLSADSRVLFLDEMLRAALRSLALAGARGDRLHRTRGWLC